jgi:quercetin dioxygenase-like cupin family protein
VFLRLHPLLGGRRRAIYPATLGTLGFDLLLELRNPELRRTHFTPRARTAWHTHPLGQTIYVTEGVGLCQRRGGEVEVIRPGESVFFEPGEDHWHGAAPNRFMTHLAMQQVDEEGSPVEWGEHVSDEEYGKAPSIDQ